MTISGIDYYLASLISFNIGNVSRFENADKLASFFWNITKRLENHFNVKVYLQNDASASTIAEKLFGSARDFSNFVYIIAKYIH